MEMCLNVNSDMISNLPENVTEQILVRLPILDAVRTSVLSTNWRYKWTTIPELVFHDDLVLPHPHDNNAKLIYLVDRVLLLHTGFIHKFELSSKWLQSFSTIDCWILFLLRKNIKELVLKFSYSDGKKYKLPSCFFSAQQLSTLELCWCILKPPPTFTGFSNLKSLYLHRTTFVDECGFECLISKCPLLERLTWDTLYDNLGHVNICSPNLKYLCLIGTFEDICFENTPLLSDVTIYLTNNFSGEELKKFLPSETGNVVKVLSSLPNLRKFVVGRFFLRFLAVGKIPEKLPFTCHHLNNLSLELSLECIDDIDVTLYLLNSFPNLQELEIEFNPLSELSGHDNENFWKGPTLVDWNMSRLQIVKITNITGFELELELILIQLLLANSPVLEMLIIRCGQLDNDRKALNLSKKLLTFPRASPKSRIKFFEWNEK